ncbi:MAG TPA: alpha/beta hydrolase [Ktedonobacteraceae bacterium]|nr:alpha/beta hydrolase [Ktedonobacteraceae bacterium]
MKHTGMLRFCRCSLLVVLAIVVLIQVPRSAHAATDAGICQSFTVPVALGVGQPLQYSIYGELCNPITGASHTVQLLIPGATYGHIYWDFPYEPQTYSYVRALNTAGYSTFNIDRIGTGLSSHPNLSLVDVTMETNAYVIHEIAQDLRNGLIGNGPFSRVLLVGHSLGSAEVWIEAGTYHDVDGVIITGLLHHLNTISLAGVLGSFYPAVLDPRFADAGYGAGYLTTEPGTRGRDFYYLPGADPSVIAADEATKETTTDGEAATFAPVLVDGISAQIRVPVLLVDGQQDSIVCGLLATNCSSAATVRQAEVPYYAPQAQLQVVVVPNAGHDLNLHETASLWFAAATAWSYQYVAP